MSDNTMPKARSAAVEAGLLDYESLFARFPFTRDAMLAAGERYLEVLRSGKQVEMPPEIKTYVHELTHYLQYTTTPYGLFLQYCRVMQSRATIVIVRALLDADLRVRMPLLENVPILTGETETTVRRYLALWLNVENLVAMLHGDRERRLALLEANAADCDRVKAGQRPQLTPLFSLQETFVRVQESMADLLEQLNADARNAGNPIPMDPEGFDRDALHQEMTNFPSALDRSDERLQLGLDLFGSHPFYRVEAIVESAATAAEFWGSDLGYNRFVSWANASVDPELQVYRECISHALKIIQTKSLPEFLMSYLALCELALYSPLLPHHAGLRRQHPGFRQFLPILRWMELLRVAGHVAPMRGTGDHCRYVTDICRELGWVHPAQIIKVAVSGPAAVSNPLAMIYLWAQRWRAQSSGDFLGVNRFLFDPSPEATAWRDMFNFVILDYADRTTYHRDKEFLEAMTTRSLNMLGMRYIMMGRNLFIPAPYRGDSNEQEWMTEWLQARFKSVFGHGFELPLLMFV